MWKIMLLLFVPIWAICDIDWGQQEPEECESWDYGPAPGELYEPADERSEENHYSWKLYEETELEVIVDPYAEESETDEWWE